jgi:hypothetical protein
MNLVVGAIAFSDAGTRAFLPVRLAELHSAVIGKARPCELPAEAGYKPAGRTGQRPVFLCIRGLSEGVWYRMCLVPELLARQVNACLEV